jgi:PII-like signaling protein
LRGTRHRARFFARNPDVPMQVVAVGTLASIADALAELRGLLTDPFVTLAPVRVCKRDGVPVEGPPAGASGWQQLTVFTSEAQLHRGRPIHREITRQLRGSGARGATTLRGIWGYHLPHAPHGDRPWRLGRHVPTVTIVIDEPACIARSYEIIDALTGEHGLVTAAQVSVQERPGPGSPGASR